MPGTDGLREALDAVERWLEATQTECVQVTVDGKSYMLERQPGELQARMQIAGSLSGDGLQPAAMKGGANGSASGARFVQAVNNSIYDVLFKFVAEDGEFWCECEDPHCEKRVTVTLREYAALRERADGPLLSRNHAPVRLPQ